ncbi:predicted protein [Sclerotinia sclerotiorum 1980 UF-70]|uniref:Uncharacterized protein n=1 Tax=Sclerotinia sclerotiorum (strain ATCC 18683 / 1980 / Ss-1) TaxID=665079 RepID=A7F661_SCLS1|nr:predicted protein [Sclerotinia sclerotiorum 1980 UF-70]EDN98232.1 predicted protein [Sclerotinia sclerotiorum 1980 UF-70]
MFCAGVSKLEMMNNFQAKYLRSGHGIVRGKKKKKKKKKKEELVQIFE